MSRWRLQAWDADGGLIFDGTCVGDDVLGEQLAKVEGRPDYKRSAVTAERGARPTFVAPLPIEHAAPVEAPPEPCLECGMPESACRAREHLSGHTFTPSTEGGIHLC